jgi:hypothetical protein
LIERSAQLIGAGAHVIALLAFDEDAPAADPENAAPLATLGSPAFACTPDRFPDLTERAGRVLMTSATNAGAEGDPLESGERMLHVVEADEYDSPWKEAIERYFEAFIAFFFPAAHAGIDWSRGYEFLDTELQQVVRDAELGRRLADKLVRVWRRDGEEAWVLIHVEVQGQPDEAFPQRMYVYP